MDDYAAFIFAQPALCACVLCDKVLSDFADEEGGFYLYSAVKCYEDNIWVGKLQHIDGCWYVEQAD